MADRFGGSRKVEYGVETYRLRHGWRLRLWLLVDRVRVWRRLRKWTPEMRDELRRVERAVDQAMFFGERR